MMQNSTTNFEEHKRKRENKNVQKGTVKKKRVSRAATMTERRAKEKRN